MFYLGVILVVMCSFSAGIFLWDSSLPCVDIVCFLLACGYVLAFFSRLVFLVFGRIVVSCMWLVVESDLVVTDCIFLSNNYT